MCCTTNKMLLTYIAIYISTCLANIWKLSIDHFFVGLGTERNNFISVDNFTLIQ